MKKNILKFIFVFAIIISTISGFAQERIVQGRIFTFDSIPLVNASVKVKSTKQVVVSDSTGKFSVKCNPKEVLMVSAHGFNSQRVKLEPKNRILIVNLKLKPGEKNREIAVGYGHVLDRDKLNSVASLQSGDMDFSQYTNMYELIRGRFAGVQIVNGEIIIRGIKSINSSNAALIVVDGVQTHGDILNSLPPIQVKSISIIKDGSSAIYGSRGANGVVIIETKRGGDE